MFFELTDDPRSRTCFLVSLLVQRNICSLHRKLGANSGITETWSIITGEFTVTVSLLFHCIYETIFTIFTPPPPPT